MLGIFLLFGGFYLMLQNFKETLIAGLVAMGIGLYLVLINIK